MTSSPARRPDSRPMPPNRHVRSRPGRPDPAPLGLARAGPGTCRPPTTRRARRLRPPQPPLPVARPRGRRRLRERTPRLATQRPRVGAGQVPPARPSATTSSRWRHFCARTSTTSRSRTPSATTSPTSGSSTASAPRSSTGTRTSRPRARPRKLWSALDALDQADWAAGRPDLLAHLARTAAGPTAPGAGVVNERTRARGHAAHAEPRRRRRAGDRAQPGEVPPPGRTPHRRVHPGRRTAAARDRGPGHRGRSAAAPPALGRRTCRDSAPRWRGRTRSLGDLLDRHHVGVVLQTQANPTLSLLALSCRARRRIQVWWTIQNTVFLVRRDQLTRDFWLLGAKRFVHRWLYRIGGHLVDGVIAVSDETARTVHDLGIPDRKVTVVCNAVDLERYPAPIDRDVVRASLGFGRDDHVMTMVGTFKRQKGHVHLIDAAQSVLPEHRTAPSGPRRVTAHCSTTCARRSPRRGSPTACTSSGPDATCLRCSRPATRSCCPRCGKAFPWRSSRPWPVTSR